jgi:mono/diheme cytochrome c family protein
MNDEPKQPANTNDAGAATGGRYPPLWLIVLFGVLLYGAGLYFDRYGGGANAQVYLPFRSVEELQALQPVKGDMSAFEFGRLVYNKPTCVACHQTSGLGTPGQFPPLVKSEWVLEAEPGRVIRIVLNGLQGPMEIKGQTFNNAMVPWKDVLNDEEIAAVLTYIRQNKDWGNNAPEVKPERVRAVREKIKDRSQPFTAEELINVPPNE